MDQQVGGLTLGALSCLQQLLRLREYQYAVKDNFPSTLVFTKLFKQLHTASLLSPENNASMSLHEIKHFVLNYVNKNHISWKSVSSIRNINLNIGRLGCPPGNKRASMQKIKCSLSIIYHLLVY